MLKKAFYAKHQTDTSFYVGSACHQQVQGATPVWVVTDLLGNILLSNQTFDEKGKPIWALTRGRLTVNRFFAAGTAMLVLSCQQTDMSGDFPPLPIPNRNNSKTGTFDNRIQAPLDKTDEICVWTGYIEGIRNVTVEDLLLGRLLRSFVGVVDTLIATGTTSQGVQMIIQCRDRMKYLMDSISTFNTTDFNPLSSTSFKAETPGTQSNPTATVIPTDGAGTTSGTQQITRADVILELARRSIGHLGNSLSIVNTKQANMTSLCNSVCGAVINNGYIRDFSQADVAATTGIFAIWGNVDNLKTLNTTNNFSGLQQDQSPRRDPDIPFLGGNTAPSGLSGEIDTYTPLAINALRLAFNIITGRAPFGLEGTRQSFFGNAPQITDRVPLEYIRYLSLQEPWPTEFFCDHRSGEYWYAPRGLDTTGLMDRKRFYRTYFYRTAPDNFYQDEVFKTINDEVTPVPNTVHEAQSVLLYREESSTINWRSNIIVTSQPISASNNPVNGVHLKVVPDWIQGRNFPCSYFVAVDNTIGNNAAELISTAMNYARIYGKELKAATMHIVGDPSLTPGEAVQVIGSPLHGGGLQDAVEGGKVTGLAGWQQDRADISEYLLGYSALYQNLQANIQDPLNLSKDAKTMGSNAIKPMVDVPSTHPKAQRIYPDSTKNVSTSVITDLSQSQLQCPASFTPGGVGATTETNTVSFPDDPYTIWRVEAVIHKFNENPGDGFRTEVALLAPF